MKFKNFNIKKPLISVFLLFLAIPQFRLRNFFLWQFFCLLTVLWIILKSVLEEGRKDFMIELDFKSYIYSCEN